MLVKHPSGFWWTRRNFFKKSKQLEHERQDFFFFPRNLAYHAVSKPRKSAKKTSNLFHGIIKKLRDTADFTYGLEEQRSIVLFCTLREKCPNTELLLVCTFLYSDWIQENTDQKKLRIWTLFSQWYLQIYISSKTEWSAKNNRIKGRYFWISKQAKQKSQRNSKLQGRE